jgi:hypothetical protein
LPCAENASRNGRNGYLIKIEHLLKRKDKLLTVRIILGKMGLYILGNRIKFYLKKIVRKMGLNYLQQWVLNKK